MFHNRNFGPCARTRSHRMVVTSWFSSMALAVTVFVEWKIVWLLIKWNTTIRNIFEDCFTKWKFVRNVPDLAVLTTVFCFRKICSHTTTITISLIGTFHTKNEIRIIFWGTYRNSGRSPQCAHNVFLFFFINMWMCCWVFVHKDEERYRPNDTDKTEYIENRWPTAIKTVFRQKTRQWHRYDCSKLGTYKNTQKNNLINFYS